MLVSLISYYLSMKFFYIFFGFIVLVFILAFLKNYTRKVELTPPILTPTPEETVSKQKIFIDQLTAKCYNEEEVAIPCKG